MRDHRTKPRFDKRAAWLAEFERLLLRERPDVAGRIDWDTAMFLFNQHASAADAAKRCAITMRSRAAR